MALGPFAAGALSGWFGYQAVIVASGLILLPLIFYLNHGNAGDSKKRPKELKNK